MDNNKHPRRNSGRGILDMHPTQLRRGAGADISPEQLHIIDINPEKRIAVAESELRNRENGKNVDRKSNPPADASPKARTEKNVVSAPVATGGQTKKATPINNGTAKTEFIRSTEFYTAKRGIKADGNSDPVKHENNVPPIQNNVQTKASVYEAPSGTADSSAPCGQSGDGALPMENAGSANGSDTRAKHKGEIKARSVVNFVVCAVFAVTLISGGFFSLMHMADKDRPVYSEFEKRNLESAPELSFSAITDGSYTEDFDKYYSDNFPLREKFVKNATVLKRLRGVRAFKKDAKQVIQGDNDIYADGEMTILIDENKFTDAPEIVIPGVSVKAPDDAEIPGEEAVIADTELSGENGADIISPDTLEKNEDTKELSEVDKSAEKGASDALKGDKRDTIYIIGDTAYEYFRGSTKSCNDYINVINTYAKYIPENVGIYTMVIPTHPEFGLSGADRTVSNEQKPVLDHIGKGLDGRVTYVNPYDRISQAYKNGEYLYFRTDHHWTVRGAYAAYLEFCDKAKIEAVPESQYEKGRVEPFLGTFYSASKQEPALAANPDYVEYFKITEPCTVSRYDKNDNVSSGALYYRKVRGEANAYLAFMGGDFPYVYIRTENTNGKKLMIFKESFGNPLIGLLVPHFEEIHVADIRYFKYNSVNFIKQYGITDVLFCNGIMSANSKARVNDLMNLMNN